MDRKTAVLVIAAIGLFVTATLIVDHIVGYTRVLSPAESESEILLDELAAIRNSVLALGFLLLLIRR